MGTLFQRMTSFSNLLEAARLASRGKRFRPNVAAFSLDLESELHQLRQELVSRSYRPGPYTTFLVHEKKPRFISAAPFRDRVVHHALCQVIEPIFERGFLYDSYACRKGKGTHAAVERASFYARRFRHMLKCDVEKYFPSIDHAVLLDLIAERIWDKGALWLIRTILEGSNPQPDALRYFPGDDLFAPFERRRGIPIGNQTSQFFANVYLDKLDHYVKETLRAPGYVRYVDDFLLFDQDKRRLHEVHSIIGDFLAQLRLRLHPRKCFVTPVTSGFTFLGYRIFPTHRRLDADNVRRFKRRLRQYHQAVAEGHLSDRQRRDCVGSWIAHARHADTVRLRTRILGNSPMSEESGLPVVGDGLER
jgi:retron-type reverse transcriptase